MLKLNYKICLFIAFSAMFLMGCSESSSSSDIKVGGIAYSSASYSGITSSNGEFHHVKGETTTFKVGSVTIGSMTIGPTSGKVSPQYIAGLTSNIHDATSIAIKQFYHSLDEDENSTNGIMITPETHAYFITEQILTSGNLGALVVQAGKTVISASTLLSIETSKSTTENNVVASGGGAGIFTIISNDG
ncbi:MAG: hypothetical protein GQ570_11360 [Helicobacteraceae bacterium]|nr:hypothetical protein [Helicobacteraceae bacterium]